MRRDTRFRRSQSHELDQMVMGPYMAKPAGVETPDPGPNNGMSKVDMSDAETRGIWSLFKNCDDPSAACHLYRSYRDSDRCRVPKETLKRFRDVMIADMREQNRNDPKRRKETKRGINAPTWEQEWWQPRKGA